MKLGRAVAVARIRGRVQLQCSPNESGGAGMALRRDAKILKMKAICSLRTAMATFNSYDDSGRVDSVLLHLQHATEMLLKAVLRQAQYQVFDKKSSTSIGFKRCLNLCVAQHELTESEAGVMRAVDALRDEAQHWFVVVEEELLYLHTRALITAFDAYLKRTLDDDLNAHPRPSPSGFDPARERLRFPDRP
ncbi:hypothetical protein [Chenggangzhangella methanolivorans]|uniref:Uncharacterized protein n=1 Tax=Chenggangzhangella methanolivorans TaxID=1437009 RepID=A0A9E6R863_9HYPH|nr:hypothetical protein [Chenggangzhangella methanolivorans]QZN99604.1 hypothetical protein K6K41_23375 [Chenggangzhangella methanolivorans]